MIEYINLLLLLTMFGSTYYVYYRLKKIFCLISIVMDSEILDQLTDLGRDVDSEFPKPKRGRKKKADSKMNELEDNDVRDKRERLVACVLSGNSKMFFGKEYTEEQINKMGCTLTENKYTFCIHVVYIFCTLCVGCTNTVYMKST